VGRWKSDAEEIIDAFGDNTITRTHVAEIISYLAIDSIKNI
jgi:hypothetical protein